jgi:hypothetical protein
MRAIPGRRRGPARLARVLGLDGNPLRRASDRAEAWLRIGVLAAFLVAGPLAAAGTAHWAGDPGTTGTRASAGPRHVVRAIVLQPASPAADLAAARTGGQVRVRARWLAGLSPHAGTVPAPAGSAAGNVVTVPLDASGRPAAASPPPGPVPSQGVLAAVLTPVLVALALLTVLRLAQRLLNRRRLAAWDAAWSAIGPQWTGRGP